MYSKDFISCYNNNQFILTEGAIGLRLLHEFNFQPDEHLRYAGAIYDKAGRKALEIIYRQYLQIAEDYSLPIILMVNTRRVNYESINKTKFKDKNVISDYTEFLREITKQYKCDSYIGGVIGCRGDAYTGENKLSVDEALSFHKWKVDELTNSNIDFIFQSIMPALNEIIGISSLIKNDMPYIVSFMIRRNGRIIDGHTINEAITFIDNAVTHKPLCYTANCVHPDILRSALVSADNNSDVVKLRFKGILANAACAEPEELEKLQDVKSSNADELAECFRLLDKTLQMKIYGGCCGTNDIHIKKIAQYINKIKLH